MSTLAEIASQQSQQVAMVKRGRKHSLRLRPNRFCCSWQATSGGVERSFTACSFVEDMFAPQGHGPVAPLVTAKHVIAKGTGLEYGFVVWDPLTYDILAAALKLDNGTTVEAAMFENDAADKMHFELPRRRNNSAAGTD
eukprot:gene10388-4730_t